jgi:two-component system NtrC family response regulator
MARVMVVDDDDGFRGALAETLESLGHEVVQCNGAAQALSRLGTPVDAIFVDLRMPDGDGLSVLADIESSMSPAPPVIILTAYASGSNTIEAMRLGAFDHLTKPIGRRELHDTLERALRPLPSAAQAAQPAADDEDLVGTSAAMREVHKRIGLAAASDAPVLVVGETGTGKERVARALHRHSHRADGPFVAINCAAIPRELLESELFGHVRGAFSGAVGDRPGCFRTAIGGVLLLDEIGEMPLDVQAKLLRVLQEGEVVPVGASRPIRVDVRVLAATHRDLASDAAGGRFRQDLLYRLDVLRIDLPPLRQRPDDIDALARHFLDQAAGRGARSLTAGAVARLQAQRWPGNARELRNVIFRSVAMSRRGVLDADDLRLTEVDAAGAVVGDQRLTDESMPAQVERLERLLIARALAKHDGNRTEAARELGLHRAQLYRKLQQYGLSDDS